MPQICPFSFARSNLQGMSSSVSYILSIQPKLEAKNARRIRHDSDLYLWSRTDRKPREWKTTPHISTTPKYRRMRWSNPPCSRWSHQTNPLGLQCKAPTAKAGCTAGNCGDDGQTCAKDPSGAYWIFPTARYPTGREKIESMTLPKASQTWPACSSDA